MAEIQTGAYSVTENARTANTVGFSQWDVKIYDTDLTIKSQRINVTGSSFTINYPTIMVKRATNVGNKKQAAANFYSTLKDQSGTVRWNIPQRLPSDSSSYTWTTTLTQGTEVQVYRRKDSPDAVKTFQTATFFNQNNSDTRLINFNWTVQLQAGSNSNQKTAGLHSRDSSIDQHAWTTTTKTSTWVVPIYLNAPPTIGTTSVSVGSPKSGSSGYADLTRTSVSVTATAQYGGYIKTMVVTVGNASETYNWSSGTTNSRTFSLKPTNTGNLSVSVTVTDSRGQTATKSLGTVNYIAKTNPTISGISLSPVSSSGKAMNGYFKGVSKLKAVVTSASTISGGNISSVTLKASGATDGTGGSTTSSTQTVTTGILNTAGSITPSVTVKDNYSLTTSKNASAITVVNPTVGASNTSLKRIGPSVTDPTHDTTYNDEGIEAVLKVTLSHTLITEDSSHINLYSAPTISIKEGNTTITDYDITWYDTYNETTGAFSNATNWTTRSSSASITVYAYIRGKNDFTFDKDTTYAVSLTPNSTYGTGATILGSIVPAFYLLAGRAGGRGLGIGRKPPTDALYVNMDSYLEGNVTIVDDDAANLSAKTIYETRHFMSVYDDGDAHSYGQVIRIGAGGNVVIGGGESAIDNSSEGLWHANINNMQGTGEDVYITADGSIQFYTGCSNDASSYKHGGVSADGNVWAAKYLVCDGANNNLRTTIGCQNSTFCHIYTDAPGFAINRYIAFVNNGSVGTISYPTGAHYVKRGSGIFLNADTYGGNKNATQIYSYDSNGIDCMMLTADGYIAIYVGNESTAPAPRCYIEYAQTGFQHTVKAPSFVNTSDKRLKEDIKTTDKNVDDIVLSLNPISYKWKESEDGKKHFGFVAQEVIELMEEQGLDAEEYGVIQKSSNPEGDGTEYYSLAYSEFIPMLVHLCQTQQKEIDKLKADIDSLKKKLQD